MARAGPQAVAPRRVGPWVALIAYMALLTILSHQSSLPGVTGWFPHQDKVAHFLAYALLGALAHRALPGTGIPRVFGAVLLAGLFGISDEWHQSLVPGRDSSLLDWVADVLGGASGAVSRTFQKNCAER